MYKKKIYKFLIPLISMLSLIEASGQDSRSSDSMPLEEFLLHYTKQPVVKISTFNQPLTSIGLNPNKIFYIRLYDSFERRYQNCYTTNLIDLLEVLATQLDEINSTKGIFYSKSRVELSQSFQQIKTILRIIDDKNNCDGFTLDADFRDSIDGDLYPLSRIDLTGYAHILAQQKLFNKIKNSVVPIRAVFWGCTYMKFMMMNTPEGVADMKLVHGLSRIVAVGDIVRLVFDQDLRFRMKESCARLLLGSNYRPNRVIRDGKIVVLNSFNLYGRILLDAGAHFGLKVAAFAKSVKGLKSIAYAQLTLFYLQPQSFHKSLFQVHLAYDLLSMMYDTYDVTTRRTFFEAANLYALQQVRKKIVLLHTHEQKHKAIVNLLKNNQVRLIFPNATQSRTVIKEIQQIIFNYLYGESDKTRWQNLPARSIAHHRLALLRRPSFFHKASGALPKALWGAIFMIIVSVVGQFFGISLNIRRGSS